MVNGDSSEIIWWTTVHLAIGVSRLAMCDWYKLNKKILVVHMLKNVWTTSLTIADEI
jgi:hypothetical protein